jgi:hypothetical protein
MRWTSGVHSDPGDWLKNAAIGCNSKVANWSARPRLIRGHSPILSARPSPNFPQSSSVRNVTLVTRIKSGQHTIGRCIIRRRAGCGNMAGLSLWLVRGPQDNARQLKQLHDTHLCHRSRHTNVGKTRFAAAVDLRLINRKRQLFFVPQANPLRDSAEPYYSNSQLVYPQWGQVFNLALQAL